MPSEFLKQRFAQCLVETGGAQTVTYIKFKPVKTSTLTKDISEEASYNSIPLSLPALVDFSPSEAMREKLGREIKFDAVLTIAREHVEAKKVTMKIGDAFILPDETERSVVTQIKPNRQHGSRFIDYLVAVQRKVGRR